jgi:DNA-binding CsgD family transcriptional regulator
MRPADLQQLRTFAEPAASERRGSPVDDDFLGPALNRWMAVDRCARVLVDDTLRAWWVNPAAEALLGETGVLVVRNHHVRTGENRFERQLRTLVERASAEVAVQCIRDPRSGEQLVLTAQRLAAPSDHLVGLTLQRASGEFVLKLADLHEAFGLTRTEARVAYHLMSGSTAEETARELRVSLETVRTHIKRGYAKLGVSSREAFFHRLTPFIILLTCSIPS